MVLSHFRVQAVVQVNDSDRTRIVRLKAEDSLNLPRLVSNCMFLDTVTDERFSSTILASPVLLFNIGQDLTSTSELILRSSPVGASEPAVPIAKSVTLARVASPISVNRVYEPLFLRSLKKRLEGRHMVKRGDMLAVDIDTDLCRINDDLDELSTLSVREIFSDPQSSEVMLRLE